jgi:aminopeptidase N
MAELWLHEAFATYSEALFWRQRFGPLGEQRHWLDLAKQVKNQEPVLGVADVNHIHYDLGDLYAKGALVLHTFASVLNDEARWQRLLLSIQQNFRYQTLSTPELMAYINQQTGQNFSYFFDQYLKHPKPPVLQLQLTERGTTLLVKYRWQADVPGFRMPIQVRKTRGRWDYITPTPTWQTLTLPGLRKTDFQVNEAAFYVNVAAQ